MRIDTFSFSLQTTVLLATIDGADKRVPLVRQREAVLKLIEVAGHNPYSLRHTAEGRPFLDGCDSVYISISHCGNHAAIALSSSPVGIDIEAVSPRTLCVIERITTEYERASVFPTTLNEELATRIWCAKESAFKLNGTQAGTITDITLSALNDNVALTASPFPSRIILKPINTYILAVAHPC